MNEAPAHCVLFDVDGLLLDTEIVYTRVTQAIVSRFGKTFDWSIKANMIGRAETESSRYLVEALELPITAEEYLAERNDRLKEGFAKCDAMPGAESLIRHLHDSGIPIAVATSSTRELFEIKISRHRHWFDLFNATVRGDDPEIRQAKPAPDIFLTAASRIDARPEETLVFEDAPSGLTAGIAAGMRVIAIPDPNMEKDRYRGATLILDNLDQFDPAMFGLPAR